LCVERCINSIPYSMNVIYAILSITGWAWCLMAMAYLFFKLRKTQ